MYSLVDYIETSCAKLKDNRMTYLYKRALLDKMTDRANEMTGAGLKDEKVILDLIADEFGDLEKAYPLFLKEQKKKKNEKLMKIAAPVLLVLILIVYFAVSGTTGAWDKSWLIIVGGIFFMIITALSYVINELCHMRRVFHSIARALIVGCVMIFMVFVFLFTLMMLPESFVVWPILPMGIILALCADLVFSFKTKQKFRTVSLFVYMIVISTMLYVILAAYGVITWAGGWPLVLAGLLVDFGYIVSVIMSNMKYFMYRQEADEE